MVREALTCLDKLDALCMESEVRTSLLSDLTHIDLLYFQPSLQVNDPALTQGGTAPNCANNTQKSFQSAISYQYAKLGIVDAKSTALLGANALLATVASIFLQDDWCEGHASICALLLLSVIVACMGAILSLRAARLKFENVEQTDAWINRVFITEIKQSGVWQSLLSDAGTKVEIFEKHLTYLSTMMVVTSVRVRILATARYLAILSALCAVAVGFFRVWLPPFSC